MTFFLWIINGLAGATAGLATALISGNFGSAMMFGAASALVASLAFGHLFRGNDRSPIPAFIASLPYSGLLGGLISAFYTEAGYLGAFLGCGVGFASGPLLGALATSFFFQDTPLEREPQNPTQFGNTERLQEPTPTSALRANQRYETISYESLSNAATKKKKKKKLPEKADGFLTKTMKAVCNLIVNVLMALIFLGVLGIIVILFV